MLLHATSGVVPENPLKTAPGFDPEHDPTRTRAQLAFRQGIEALPRQPGAQPAHIHWLRRQQPVAMNDDGWILIPYPSDTDARVAAAHEAMVRLGHVLRAEQLAAGVHTFACNGDGNATPADEATEDSGEGRRRERSPWERGPVFLPSFLVKTTLPHTDPKTHEFERVNGNVVTTLQSIRRRGLPFGVYPRLIAVHLATGAIRARSRKLLVGRSINELLARMRIPNSGGKNGPSKLARDQLDRLCATRFITSHLSPAGPHQIDFTDSWPQKTPAGIRVDLSERFFAQVRQSSVPLDPVVLRAHRRSPLAIDIYGWITYRLSTLQEPTAIPWRSLEKQFGADYKNPRQFRWRFRQSLEQLKNAWPAGLQVDVDDRRLLLHPGPSSVGTRTERSNAKRG